MTYLEPSCAAIKISAGVNIYIYLIWAWIVVKRKDGEHAIMSPSRQPTRGGGGGGPSQTCGDHLLTFQLHER